MDSIQLLRAIVDSESKNPQSLYANIEALAKVFVKWLHTMHPEVVSNSPSRDQGWVLFLATRIVQAIFRKEI